MWMLITELYWIMISIIPLKGKRSRTGKQKIQSVCRVIGMIPGPRIGCLRVNQKCELKLEQKYYSSQ